MPDRFEAVEELPPTPFERTFRAFDRVLLRQVLLKLPGAGAWDGWSTPVRERLLREARALARVRHEGIVPIHWVEETPEGPLLVLDLPEGEMLQDRLAAGPLAVDAARELGIQLAEALGAVHYHGIVHRAVSADSVRVLADDTVRLGTFTFAKGFEARPHMSSIDHRRRAEPAVAAFLPPYVAPEQLAGQGANPRTDVFALGCLLFRCLAGRDPFPAGSVVGALPDLRAQRRDVPKALCEVLRRCTQAASTARYPTAMAVAEALRATRPGAVVAGPGRRTFLATAGIGALTLGGLGYWMLDRGRGPEEPQRVGTQPAPPPEKYSDRYGKCHALLIGIGKAYGGSSHVRLDNPEREVLAVRERLLANDPEHWRGGITLLTEQQADKKAILEALERLETGVGPEDAVLLYFSGHGVKVGEFQYFLVPAGTTGEDPNHGEGYLPDGRIENFFAQCPAKHVLVVLDCCYSGNLFQHLQVKGRPVGQSDGGRSDLAAPFLRHKSRQLIASSAGPAADGVQVSRFNEAFVKALTPSADSRFRGFVHARAVYSYIHGRVGLATAGGAVQEPLFRELTPPDGSFVFYLPK